MSEIEELESISSAMSGITESEISKTSATFQDLVVTGDVTFSVDQLDFQSLTASSITVDGKSVSLEGHGHSASDISDFASAVASAGASVFASASHTHDGLQGLTSNSISKNSASFNSISASTATFDNLVVTGDVTMSLSQVQFGSIVASDISVNGSQVSLEGHVHGMSEIDGLESSISQLNVSVSAFASAMSGLDATSISKSSATFGDLVVTGSVTFSADQLDFDTLTASTILLNGSSVSVEGHLHSIPDVSGLAPILSGITESSIWKNQVSASAATFDQVTADVGTFRLLSVSGSANFSVNNVSANSVSVNGSAVSLEGHTHSFTDVTGLSSSIDSMSSQLSSVSTALSSLANGLSGQTFDFSEVRGIYLALSSIITIMGGSVSNFPSFNQ